MLNRLLQNQRVPPPLTTGTKQYIHAQYICAGCHAGSDIMGQKLLMPGVVHPFNMSIGEHCNTGFLLRPSQLLVVHMAVDVSKQLVLS